MYSDLEIDDVPRELVRYDGYRQVATIELDDVDEVRRGFTFSDVVGLRLVPSPCFDRRRIFVDGSYVSTILVENGSEWIAEINAAERRAGEPETRDVAHFIVPSDAGVWEILAKQCNRGTGDE
jgi:hypothetical protein